MNPAVASTPLLTIAVSTIGANLAGIVLPPPNPEVRYLVVIQRPGSAKAFPQPPRQDVRYVGLDSVGLSRSRNAALALVDTPLMLLADDDLVFDIEAILHAARELSSQGVDFAVGQLTQGPSREVRVSWPLDRSPTEHDTGMFASCEMLFDVRKLRAFGLAFDPDFGVGSGVHPAGEESFFMLHLLRAGARGIFVPHVLVHHEEMSSGYRYLGVRGAVGAMTFAQTLRPRPWPVLRRLRYVVRRKDIPLWDKFQVVCSPSPRIAPRAFDATYDPASVIYDGTGAQEGVGPLLAAVVSVEGRS